MRATARSERRSDRPRRPVQSAVRRGARAIRGSCSGTGECAACRGLPCLSRWSVQGSDGDARHDPCATGRVNSYPLVVSAPPRNSCECDDSKPEAKGAANGVYIGEFKASETSQRCEAGNRPDDLGRDGEPSLGLVAHAPTWPTGDDRFRVTEQAIEHG